MVAAGRGNNAPKHTYGVAACTLHIIIMANVVLSTLLRREMRDDDDEMAAALMLITRVPYRVF